MHVSNFIDLTFAVHEYGLKIPDQSEEWTTGFEIVENTTENITREKFKNWATVNN